MSPSLTVSLLARWETARAQGRDLSAAEVCHDCPEQALRIAPLLEALRRLPPTAEPEDVTVYASLSTLPPPPELTAAARYLSVPGYEVLGELGRGGMGVVFRARQVALGRAVALKVILSGEYASAEVLARFRAEGEAVAAIGHPGVVQVYELGTHTAASGEQLPFLAMEHCPGGSLAERLRGGPLAPAEAARLVEALARAVQAAHAKGVVHRDLKPANVLFGADGLPRVADFGLARRLEGGALTASGAVLGTPSYMAPEQARREKGVGPQADIYALGAILYECLTGRPPFLAATAVDTILQVVGEEPAAPRSLNAKLPRDAENICLKCLQKEPARRYASAGELGDDLGRFGRGEPVRARPVGALERARKWVRRNPAVAALSAVAAVAVLAGVAASTWFALDARAEAAAARQSAEEADRERQAAQRSATEAERARDDAEVALVEGWLRPLGWADKTELDLAEREALQALGEKASDRLCVRFFEAGLRDDAMARRLGRRAEWVIQAGVRLRQDRREAVKAVVLRRLGAAKGEPDVEMACLLLGAALGVDDGAFIRRLCLGVTKTPDRRRLEAFAWALEELSPRLSIEDARRTAEALAAIKTTDADQLRAIGRGLAVLAPRLPPAEARRHANAATDALFAGMAKSIDPIVLRALTAGLVGLAPQLGPDDTRRLAEALAAAMPRAADYDQLEAMARSVAALAPRADTGDVGLRAAQALTAAMGRMTGMYQLLPLVRGLEALAPQLSPDDARRAAEALAAAMTRTTDQDQLSAMAQGLAALAPRLDGAEVRRATYPLVAALGQAAGPNQLRGLSAGLEALAPRLARPDARRAADALAEALPKTANRERYGALARGLAALAPRLGPADDRRAAVAVVTAIGRSVDPGLLTALATQLEGLAGRLSPEDARQASATLSALKTLDPDQLEAIGKGLAALAPRLPPGDARRHAAAVAERVARSPESHRLVPMARSLQALAPRLPPADARRPAAALAEGMSRAMNPGVLAALATGVRRLAPRLARDDARRTAEALLAAMGKADDHDQLEAMALGVAALAARLGGDGRPLAAAAAEALAKAMAKASNSARLVPLVRGLETLGPLLAAGDARRAVEALAKALAKATDHGLLEAVGRALRVYPASLTGEHCRAGAEQLVHALGLSRAPATMMAELTALAARLDTDEVMRLLQHPLAATHAQGALLNSLATRARGPFPNAWAFLDWAADNGAPAGLGGGSAPPIRPLSGRLSRQAGRWAGPPTVTVEPDLITTELD